MKSSVGAAIGALCAIGAFGFAITLIAADDHGSERRRTLGVKPEMHLIDEMAGTYAGVGLLDSSATVRTALKGVRSVAIGDPWIPQDIHTPEHRFFKFPDRPLKSEGELVNRGAYFNLTNGLVVDIGVFQDGAATLRGVAVGDALSEAGQAYPGLACGTIHQGPDSDIDAQVCSGRVAPRRFIWFGGDPIDLIDLNLHRFPHISVRPVHTDVCDSVRGDDERNANQSRRRVARLR
jgi:hypothetical protein